MKLTGVPAPFPRGPRGGIIRTVKEIRARCGINLRDARALYNRVLDGEGINLPLLPGKGGQDAVNAFLGLGCSVHPQGDPPTREQIAEVNEDALFADGFEDALIGYVELFGRPPLALYDRDKCIEILLRDGGTYEEAAEHLEFNTIGAWAGDNTPAFATLLTRDDASTNCPLTRQSFSGRRWA